MCARCRLVTKPKPNPSPNPNPNPNQVADFVWLDQDLYLKADVEVGGKSVLVGRGKAKAVEGGEGASLASRHTKPLLEVN